MATNRTMMMAMGKLGKKSDAGAGAGTDDEYDEPSKPAASGDDEEEEGEETDDKKQAFVDMCKAIKSGDYDKAYELYEDLCEGM